MHFFATTDVVLNFKKLEQEIRIGNFAYVANSLIDYLRDHAHRKIRRDTLDSYCRIYGLMCKVATRGTPESRDENLWLSMCIVFVFIILTNVRTSISKPWGLERYFRQATFENFEARHALEKKLQQEDRIAIHVFKDLLNQAIEQGKPRPPWRVKK